MSSYLSGNRPPVAAVLTALRGLSREIDRLDEIAAKRFGVNRTDLRCLELLGSAGALTPTELATALGFTTGGMTTVIDRLERAGYARRRPDPHDRRKVIVEATDLLAARQGEIFGDLLRNTEALIATYSDAQLETIRDFLERSRAVIRAQGDRIGVFS
ncbi:MAG TPA: MarR family transcriptional regulator [Chloroflexota bacterium]|nr:MarR family transcriptional regulator [Chloroflexota bacterium]